MFSKTAAALSALALSAAALVGCSSSSDNAGGDSGGGDSYSIGINQLVQHPSLDLSLIHI